MTKRPTKEEFKYCAEWVKKQPAAASHWRLKPHVGASVYNTATMVQMMTELDIPGLGAELGHVCTSSGPEKDATDTIKKLAQDARGRFSCRVF